MSKFFQRSWFLVLGTWTRFSKAIPQDKISINQSINPITRVHNLDPKRCTSPPPLPTTRHFAHPPPIFYPAIAPKNVPTKPQRLPDLLPARRPRQSTPSLSFLPSSLLSFILPPPAPVPYPAFLTAPLPRHTPN